MKKISKEKLSKLKRDGASVTVKTKPATGAVAAERQLAAIGTQTAALATLASHNDVRQAALIEKVVTLMESNKDIQAHGWRFIINRNKRGLMETIDAVPVND